MASSQIEIPSASCILRDQNQRDRFRESENGRLAFHKNIKDFVRDLHACSSTPISINSSTIMTPGGLRKINARRSTSPENDTTLVRQPSLPRSAGNSPNVGGASSLVQMWEARLNRSHSFNQNMINSTSSSRTNSGLSITECASSLVSESKKPEIEMDNQSQLSHHTAEDTEAESQQNASESASESERVRVADIIKRLTKTSSGGEDQGSNDHEHSRESSPDTLNPAFSSTSSSPKTATGDKFQGGGPSTCSRSPRIRERSSLLDQQLSSPRVAAGEGRVAFPQMSNLPRLRGRQAIQDLLMQMERDKQSEISSLEDRKAVSKFTHKGRIQSMLRLKVLQRGLMSPQDHLVPPPPTRPKGTSSSMAARRSRFDPEAESQGASKPSEDESTSRGLNEEDDIPKDVTNSQVSSRFPCQENTGIGHGEAVKTRCDSTSKDSLKDLKQDEDEGGDSVWGEAGTVSTAALPCATERASDASEYMHEMGSLNSYVTWQDPCFESSYWDGNGSMMSGDDTRQQHYVAESSSSYYDWFSDICRPRRYWEDRRQAWYQEVLQTTSEDAEIRRLLERKTVSNFLDSSFRLRMDQLMMTRLSHQTVPADGEDYSESEDRTNQVTMRLFFRRQLGQSSQQEQEDQRKNVEQMDPEEGCYFEQNAASPQLPLPSPMSSSRWSSFREPELSEDESENRHASIGTAPTPSTNPASLEMELIYDLKGHLEQLYQEMSELRKSIRCCMAKLHFSSKREQETTKKAGNGTASVTLKKGSCCICYEMPVDSLLYRCGHMCTCLKCAKELQWSSGRCPICRAHIMDAVRAYTDS